MVHAVLVCSEPECTAVYEAFGNLEEVEALACECDCALEIIGWPDQVAPGDDQDLELTLVAA